MFYNPWMPYPYMAPQSTDPIAQTKAFLDFMNEFNERNKKKDEKKDDKGPKINWAQSMLFMLFVMPMVGIFVSALQFYVFASLLSHLK